MTMDTTTSPFSQIEALNSWRVSLWDGCDDIEDGQFDLKVEQSDTIFDVLSYQTPASLHEVDILLGALNHHVQLLAFSYTEIENDELREERAAKAVRIINAVRAALPGLD